MKWISFQKEIEITCVKVPYFLFGGEWQKEVMREWERESEREKIHTVYRNRQSIRVYILVRTGGALLILSFEVASLLPQSTEWVAMMRSFFD